MTMRDFREMAATTGDFPETSPRSEWRTVIALTLLVIVAAFGMGYLWAKVGPTW